MGWFVFWLVAATVSGGVVVLDRIAVIAGKHVIKTSDIDRDLRVTEFLNRQPLNLGPQARREAAERLIDQQIIRDEVVNGDYKRPSDADAEALEADLRRERFGASEAKMQEALQRYGISESVLRAQLLWQLTVLRFIDQRFRPEINITDEEVRSYYDQHLSQLRREYQSNSSFTTLEPKIRNLLEGQRINEAFDQWLADARKRTRIEFKQEAFQ